MQNFIISAWCLNQFSHTCSGPGVGWKRISRHETEWGGNKVYPEWEMLLEQWDSSRESWCWVGVLSLLLYTQGTSSRLGVLGVICQLDKAHILGGEKSKANPSSLWGMRGDRLCCSINSYNMGEGRVIRVLSLHFCIPRASLVLSAHPSLVTTTPTGIWARGSFYNQDTTRGKGEDIRRMMKMKFSNEISE